VGKQKEPLTVAPAGGHSAGSGIRLAIGFKLLVGICVVFAMLSAAIAVAVLSIFSLTRDQAQLQERNVPYAVALATAALNAKGIANDERGFLISGDREFLEEIDQRLLNVRTAFVVAGIAADGETQTRAVDRAQAGFERWVRALEKELATFQAGDRAAARRSALGPGRELRKAYEASLAEAQSIAKIAIHKRRNTLASSGWALILLASLLIVLLVGTTVTFWLVRALDAAADAAPTPEPTLVRVPPLGQQADRLERRDG
jgi:methyl-accepting chemotaxis protein